MIKNNIILNQNDKEFIIDNVDGKTSQYYFDLTNQQISHLTIKITDNSNVDVVVIISNQLEKLIFDIGKCSNVKLQFIVDSIDKNVAIVGNLYHGANVIVALADFTNGQGFIDVHFSLLGKESYLDWRLASLSSNEDEKKYAINFTHKSENTYAMMSNFGVTEHKSKLHFTGNSHIVKGAHNSKTHQKAKIMVFDSHCVGRADPVLIIDENEVAASHAATVGKLSEEHLFYLQSRGINKQTAKRLITRGYLQPIINYFTDDGDKVKLTSLIEREL
jgi:Fe-S cluster assembly protein SufD